MVEADTTVGIYIGEDDVELIREFDEAFPHDSRSEKIKDAMRLYLAVEHALEDVDYEMPEPSKRHWVAQAIRGEAAREADR